MTIPSEPAGLSFVPRDVLRVMEKIHGEGFDVWIVGGALRDRLLGLAAKDWDLATGAGPEWIMRLFPRVIPVGLKHGTVQVHTRSRDIEVTSYAPPGEAGILKDLSRRDFTMNALALSYPEGLLIDPFGGRDDLKKRLLRAVGDPAARFSEDPLRILRAGRLSAAYGFAVDPGTFRAMHRLSETLEKVSAERIRDEVCKILLARYPVDAFDLLGKSGAIRQILPELAARDRVDALPGSGLDIYRHSLLCVVHCPERLRVRLAALLQNCAVPVRETGGGGESPFDYRRESALAASARMKKWNMSNRQIEEVSCLVENRLPPDAEGWSDSRIRQFIARVGTELLDDFVALAASQRTVEGEAGWQELERFHGRLREQVGVISAMRIQDLAVGGGDIMRALGLSQGPEVGRVLRKLFERVLEDPALNTREHLMEIVRRDFTAG